MKLPIILALLAGAVLRAAAHEVWIEEHEGALVVRFAEFGDEPEKSPGALDALSPVAAWAPAEGKAKAFTVAKKSDHFLLEGAKPGEAAQAETGFPVRKSGDKPARKPNFYARWQPAGAAAPAAPALTLDLLPGAKPGEVRVLFRGQPVAAAKLKLHPPTGDERELTSDAQGVVQLGDIKADGFYLLTYAHHSETLPGFFAGAAYDIASHNASLAWRQGPAPKPVAKQP